MKRFLLSDQTKNSYGFRVKTSGISLKRFKNNPVMLLEHDRRIVLGKWLDLKTEEDKLLGLPEFDQEDDQALKISNKVEKGYIKGVSVGLIPLKFEEIENEKGQLEWWLTKSELTEASVCSVPSNANALVLYDTTGVILSDEKISLHLSEFKNQSSIKPMKFSDKTLKQLGLSETAKLEEIENAIGSLVQKNADLEALQKTTQELSVKTFVDTLIKSGKAVEKQRVQITNLATKDFEGTVALFAEAGAPSKPSQHISSGANDERAAWSLSDWKKKDYAGLIALKTKEPEKYNQLIAQSKVLRHL